MIIIMMIIIDFSRDQEILDWYTGTILWGEGVSLALAGSRSIDSVSVKITSTKGSQIYP